MHAFAFLGFLLPLVASLPSAINGRSDVSRLAERKMLMNLSHFSFKNWTMSEVCMECTRATVDVMYDCTFKFQWDDPNFNTSSYCKNYWQWDGATMAAGPNNTYNTDYFVCEEDLPELWQFKFFQIDDAGGFNMSMAHRCVDDIHFQPNTEVAEFFSSPNITLGLANKTDLSIVYLASDPLFVKIEGLTI